MQVERPRSAYSDVLAGLSYALDLTEGHRPGHCVRSCLIGLRLADAAGIDPGDRSSLFQALLMKDLGCSSHAARFAALFGADNQSLEAGAGAVGRGCDHGAEIARLLGLSDATVAAIRALDEHWNGRGRPFGLAGQEIPRLARVLDLAQTCEVFLTTCGPGAMFEMAAMRRGRWFDPALVDVLIRLRGDRSFWTRLATVDALAELCRADVPDSGTPASDADLDRTAEAFAHVIDAKSPWTYRHSTGVADIAVRVAGVLGVPEESRAELRRAALLHDLGKLGVSNVILEKPGPLDAAELAAVNAHPDHTARILERVPALSPLAELAGAHHERLDGRGYPRGLGAAALTLPQRILATADVADALRTSRPYRAGLPPERVLAIMRRDAGAGLDGDCVEAFASIHETLPAAGDPPAAATGAALGEDYTHAA